MDTDFDGGRFILQNAVARMAKIHHEHEYYAPPLGLELNTYLAEENKQGVHHAIRYLWAIEAIEKIGGAARILDFGCGEGYGAHAVADAYPEAEVVAMDYDASAIAAAAEKYRRPNLRFMVGDTRQWYPALERNAFDVTISFDVVEHIEHRELFFFNLTHYIRDGGCLFLSTPCGGKRPVHANPRWKHHKIEYNVRALYDVLRRYFAEVLRIDDPKTDFPARDVFERLAGGSVQYLNMLNPVVCRDPIKIEDPYADYLAGLEEHVSFAENISVSERRQQAVGAERAAIVKLEQQVAELTRELKRRKRPLLRRLVRRLRRRMTW